MVRAGGGSGSGGGSGGAGGMQVPVHQNLTAQDMLLKMPGVTPAGARKLMAAAPSLAALAQLRKEQLKDVLGAANGARLHKFLHQELVVPGST